MEGPRECNPLVLRAGEWVKVRSLEKILATLDELDRRETLSFLPEMLQYCHKWFRVFRRAEKTCNYIQRRSIRQIKDSAHFEGKRYESPGMTDAMLDV